MPDTPPARLLRGLLAAVSLLVPLATVAPASAAPEVRTFPQTGFAVDGDAFWDFFRHRGGVRTLGYPVSRTFLFKGCNVQLFQRLALQQCGSQAVGTLNLLDDGLLPYTRINGSVFPSADPLLQAAAPTPSDPAYGDKVTRFVRDNAPDTFEGEPVSFAKTFFGTVSASDAFPGGGGDPNLLPLINLQVWGLPTSKPQRDPTNRSFIYQRFQRGIMHYDAGCRCTQGLLLADYLKALLTGQNLPADLAAQAQTSPLYRAAVSGSPGADGTNYTGAFVRPDPSSANGYSPPPTASLSDDQRAFITDVGAAATRLQSRTGLAPSLVVAIAINETGWGKSVLARDGNNYFGIKALTGPGTAGTLSVDTWEVQDGQTISVRAPFRAYTSLDDSISDLGDFLHASRRFSSVWQQGSDPGAIARAMQQAGYATDPAWPDKLVRIIDRYGLRSLDTA
jgi:Mannosyl-glycoprotein endo-beta-N-acetylglucosaminidase